MWVAVNSGETRILTVFPYITLFEYLQFSDSESPPHKYSPTVISFSFLIMNRASRHTESNSGLRSLIALLMICLQARISPIFRFSNSSHKYYPTTIGYPSNL